MNFHNHPFLIIAPVLCLGIIAEDAIQFEGELLIWGVLIGILSSIVLQLINFNKKVLTVVLFFLIVLLGAFTINSKRQNFANLDGRSKITSYLVQVDEMSEGKGDWHKSICSIQKAINEGEVVDLNERVLLILNADNIVTGDVLMVHSELKRIRNKNNPGEFDSEVYWKNQNINRIGFVSSSDIRLVSHNSIGIVAGWFESVQESLSDILTMHLEGSNLSIARALILGDKSLLSKENRDSFSNAGAMHVLAVSGLHVGIILYIFIFIFRQFPKYISRRNALLFSVLLIWFYAGITGFSPSVLRASFMFSMLVLGQILSRQTDTLNILFFTAFVLLLINPLLIYNIGFQLSYLAMIGILLLYKPVSNIFQISNKWLLKAWEGTAIGISAQLVTVPLTLYYFHQFPNYFALSNLFVMVFAGIILGLGLFLFLFNKVGFLGHLLGVILGFLLMILLDVIEFIESLPGAVAYGFQLTEGVLLVTYLGLFLLLFFDLERILRFSIIACLFVVFTYIQFERFVNYNKEELVVFNSNQFTAAVKMKNQIVCIHAADRDESEKHKYLMEAYQKVNPGTVNYVELKNGKTTIKSEGQKIVFEMKNGGVEIVNSGFELFVRTGYKKSDSKIKRVIDMPYLEGASDSYNLRNGAFILSK